MEDLFNRFKDFILPGIVLIQLLIVLIKKVIEKRNEREKDRIWSEFSRILGYKLKESPEGNKYIEYRIGDHRTIVTESPLISGLQNGIVIAVSIKPDKVNANFELRKNPGILSRKTGKSSIRSNKQQKLENIYTILATDGSFSRKLLKGRIITHLLDVQPEALFFLSTDNEDSKHFLPVDTEQHFYLIISFTFPKNRKEITEHIELVRIITKTIDSI